MNKKILGKIANKVALNITLFLIVIFIIILLTNIPINLNFARVNDKLVSNMDFQLYIENVIKSIKGLTTGEYLDMMLFRKGMPVKEITSIVLGRSMRLFFIALTLSVIIGIPKGILDSRRKKKQSTLKLLQALIPLSVPDVLIISLVQLLGFYLYRQKYTILGMGPIMHIGYEHWTQSIYPIIALSLVPAAYIARITASSIEIVYDKDYILTARGKGCSEARIILKHTMKNVLTDIIASFPAIVSIMFSSLFIVERIFYFPGITFEMLDLYYKPANDGSTTVALLVFASALGVIYFVFYTLLDVARQVLVPKLKS